MSRDPVSVPSAQRFVQSLVDQLEDASRTATPITRAPDTARPVLADGIERDCLAQLMRALVEASVALNDLATARYPVAWIEEIAARVVHVSALDEIRQAVEMIGKPIEARWEKAISRSPFRWDRVGHDAVYKLVTGALNLFFRVRDSDENPDNDVDVRTGRRVSDNERTSIQQLPPLKGHESEWANLIREFVWPDRNCQPLQSEWSDGWWVRASDLQPGGDLYKSLVGAAHSEADKRRCRRSKSFRKRFGLLPEEAANLTDDQANERWNPAEATRAKKTANEILTIGPQDALWAALHEVLIERLQTILKEVTPNENS